MSHFGAMSPEAGGHLHPMMSLARELHERGHRVTFYQRPICRAKIEAKGFVCRSFDADRFPPEATEAVARKLSGISGLRGLRYTIEVVRQSIGSSMDSVPAQMREDGVEALLLDEAIAAGPSIAEAVGVPYIQLSIALLMDGEPRIPPFCTSWSYRTGRLGILRNILAYKILGRLMRPVGRTLGACRRRLGLGIDPPSPIARISQQVTEFDFPRRHLSPLVQFVGPLSDPSVRLAAEFPYERLDGRPLIYASLGSMLGRKTHVFRCIAEACDGLAVQLVISLGGAGDPRELGDLRGAPVVVGFAPQLEILKRAALCITHAGLNTTLECLAEGVPMVAIPFVNDAPGVAARIAWTGCGEMLSPLRLTPSRLRRKVIRVLNDPSYRTSARRLRDAIQLSGGVARAADIVEAAAKLLRVAIPVAAA